MEWEIRCNNLSTSAVKKKDLSNVQMLRAFAALSVVFFHAIGTSESYGFGTSLLSRLKEWGASGVDMFFVISGFIMVYVQIHKHYSPVTFFANRLIRIAPLYWSLSAMMVILYVAAPSMFRQMELTPQWTVASLLFLSAAIGESYPILIVGWTLELEMLFYLIFSVSLLLKPIKASILLSVAAIVVFVALTGKTIMLEFAFGMMIGFFSARRQFGLILLRVSLMTGVSLLVLSLALRGTQLDRVIIWGVPSALIVFALVNLRQYKLPLLAKLGDASYSIYLVQVFTLPVFYKLLKWFGAGPAGSDVYITMSVLATAIVGYVTYILYESKIALSAAKWRIARQPALS